MSCQAESANLDASAGIADGAPALEKALASAVMSGDETKALSVFAQIDRADLEYTGRCYSLAIAQGMVDLSLAFGRAGFCLDATDEPAVRQMMERDAGMRALRPFLQRYSYCRARRTAYIPVADSPDSAAPVRALMADGVGLSEADASELLSLAIRRGNVALAEALAGGGAQLPLDIREGAPEELRIAVGDADAFWERREEAAGRAWADLATPQLSMEMLDFVLGRCGEIPCRISGGWMLSYGRLEEFPRKLAKIALQSDCEHCDAPSAVLMVLSENDEVKAVSHVLTWPSISREDVLNALLLSREAGMLEMSALLMKHVRSTEDPLTFLAS